MRQFGAASQSKAGAQDLAAAFAFGTVEFDHVGRALKPVGLRLFIDVYTVLTFNCTPEPAMTIANTRIFKSGNSLAVRIPKEMTPDDVPQDAQIEWSGGVWTIRPLHRRSLAGLMDRFKAFSPDFMADGREFNEQKERDWSGADAAGATDKA